MNRYGLDTDYFERLMKREFSDLNNYTPAEFARVCARMAVTADSSVLDEPEFAPSTRCDHIPTPFGTPAIWRCCKCGTTVDKPKPEGRES